MRKHNLYRRLFALVVPIALQNLLSAIVNASDAIMLGGVNQILLSAVSLATQVTFVYFLFISAITIGLTTLASQYWGKKDFVSVEKILGIALRYSVIISVVFSFLTGFAPAVLMKMFTADSVMIKEGSVYLRIISPTYLFMGFSQIYLCAMKNSGRTLKSTIYSSTTVFLNLILNGILIYGLFGMSRMEIGGAAMATLISRFTELLFVIIENSDRGNVRIRTNYMFHPDMKLKKDFVHYTSPVILNEIAWGCGFTMFSVIMGHLGTDAVAANSIANIAKNIVCCTCLGIGTGSSILIGNELGYGNIEQAKNDGDRLCRIAIINGIICGILIILCRPIIMAFGGNLTATAAHYLEIELLICGYYMIGKSVNSTTISGIFCAGGDTTFGMICDTITLWFICVPLGAIAAFILKLPVLWVYFILNLDEIIKLPAVYVHYKKYKWAVNLTKE